jgi:hypothetical protein
MIVNAFHAYSASDEGFAIDVGFARGLLHYILQLAHITGSGIGF